MKKTNMKLLLFIFSFVAFATSPLFSQNYVSSSKAVQLLTKYEQQFTIDIGGSRSSEASLDRVRSGFANMVLRDLKQGMTVSAAITDTYGRLYNPQQPGSRNTMTQTVRLEVIELLTAH